jgi:hypothetical protein
VNVLFFARTQPKVKEASSKRDTKSPLKILYSRDINRDAVAVVVSSMLLQWVVWKDRELKYGTTERTTTIIRTALWKICLSVLIFFDGRVIRHPALAGFGTGTVAQRKHSDGSLFSDCTLPTLGYGGVSTRTGKFQVHD